MESTLRECTNLKEKQKQQRQHNDNEWNGNGLHNSTNTKTRTKMSREPSIIIPTADNDWGNYVIENKETFKSLNAKEQKAFNKIFQPGGLERQNSTVAGSKKKKRSLTREPSNLNKGTLERQKSILETSEHNIPDRKTEKLSKEHSTLQRQNSILVKSNEISKTDKQRQREHSTLNSTPKIERQKSIMVKSKDEHIVDIKSKNKQTYKERKNNKVFPTFSSQNSVLVGIGGTPISIKSEKHLKPPSRMKKSSSIRSLHSDVNIIVETPSPMRLEDWATAIYNEAGRKKAAKRVGPWMHLFKKLKIPNPFQPKGNTSRNSRKSFRSYKTL